MRLGLNNKLWLSKWSLRRLPSVQIRNLFSQLNARQFNLPKLRFTKAQFRQRLVLILSILFFIFALVALFFSWQLVKKSRSSLALVIQKPEPAGLQNTRPPLQLVIQKPEPVHIQKIERAASNAELAEFEYQEAIAQLHQQGEVVSPAQIQTATIRLKRVLTRLPVYPAAREALVALLIKQSNLQEAARVVEMGLSQNPSYLPYLKLKLHILVKQGRVDQAITLLENIPPAAIEGDVDYLVLVAQIYLQQRQYAQAVQAYRTLLQSNPNNASWAMGLGIALEGLGKRHEALEIYRAAQLTATPQARQYIEQRMQALR